VKKNRVLLIYSLKDTSEPVVYFEKGEFNKCFNAFVSKKDEDIIYFTLLSRSPGLLY
jgi:hypothetical protein